MGKVVLLLLLLNVNFLLAKEMVKATVENGSLTVFRDNQKFQAGEGVYLYPGDLLYLDSEAEFFFADNNVLLKALSNCEIKIKDTASFQLFAGTVYVVCDQQPELSFIFKESKISLAARKYVLSKEIESLVIYNLADKFNISAPLSLSIPKDNYIVFTGNSFSRPAVRKLIYQGILPDPFLSPITVRKNLGTTCWLSAVLPGLGHIYSDSRLKGLIAITTALALLNNIQNNENKAVYFSLWSWAFLDSIAETRKYNEELKK